MTKWGHSPRTPTGSAISINSQHLGLSANLIYKRTKIQKKKYTFTVAVV